MFWILRPRFNDTSLIGMQSVKRFRIRHAIRGNQIVSVRAAETDKRYDRKRMQRQDRGN